MFSLVSVFIASSFWSLYRYWFAAACFPWSVFLSPLLFGVCIDIGLQLHVFLGQCFYRLFFLEFVSILVCSCMFSLVSVFIASSFWSLYRYWFAAACFPWSVFL